MEGIYPVTLVGVRPGKAVRSRGGTAGPDAPSPPLAPGPALRRGGAVKPASLSRPAGGIAAAALALVLGLPRTALALQPHGPPEGLYVHQIAHLLFAVATLFLLYHLRRERLPGLPWFLGAGILFIVWNLTTLVGHAAELSVAAQDFLGAPAHLSRRLLMSGPAAWTYYVTKLDHLILLPAFILLYFGLQALARAPRPRGET